jgi:hypothetical protein
VFPGIITSGDYVNARLLLEVHHDVLSIPSSAIQRAPDGIFIWVITANDIVHIRKITAGPISDIQTIITSGVAEGEHVVVDGQYKLQENSKVQVTTPPAVVAKRKQSKCIFPSPLFTGRSTHAKSTGFSTPTYRGSSIPARPAIRRARQSLAVARCYAYLRAMVLSFDPTDYSVVVKHRAPPPKSWRWEIYRAGRTSAIEQSSLYFETMATAGRAGKEALKQLLEKLQSKHPRWPLT